MLLQGYESFELIGEGGLGRVFRARRSSTGGLVAVKELRDVQEASPAWHRARRELEALLRLKGHPYVINVEEIVQGPNGPCLVMELAPHGSLLDRLAERPFTPAEIVLIGQQVCDALSAAHSLGIVHRDIKPHNLLVGAFGQVKVCDFGISQLTREGETRTKTGALTMAYASPEEIDGDVEIGPAADVYSLGATLLHLVTGRRPSFKNRMDTSTIDFSGVDPALKAVVVLLRQSLAHDVDDRPTIDDMSAVFDQTAHRFGAAHARALPIAAAAANPATGASIAAAATPSAPPPPPRVASSSTHAPGLPAGTVVPPPPPGYDLATVVRQPLARPTAATVTGPTIAVISGAAPEAHKERRRKGVLFACTAAAALLAVGGVAFVAGRDEPGSAANAPAATSDKSAAEVSSGTADTSTATTGFLDSDTSLAGTTTAPDMSTSVAPTTVVAAITVVPGSAVTAAPAAVPVSTTAKPTSPTTTKPVVPTTAAPKPTAPPVTNPPVTPAPTPAPTSPPTTVAATSPPPTRTVSINRVETSPTTCQGRSPCYWIVGSMSGFSGTVTVQCFGQGAPFYTFSTSSTSFGTGKCWVSAGIGPVFVIVNGVQSNTLLL